MPRSEELPLHTIGQLRDAIQDLPDNCPVLSESKEHPWQHHAQGHIIQLDTGHALLISAELEPF